jgi:fimbrial isopeptide formation D2 family protein/LPXTG-motif cell wall-anchored protein
MKRGQNMKTTKTIMKRILSVSLAIMLTVLMSIPVFATSVGKGDAVNANDKKTATIQIFKANKEDVLYLYKAINVTLNEDNTLTYEFTNLFKDFLKTEAGQKYQDVNLMSESENGLFETDSAEIKEMFGLFTAFIKETKQDENLAFSDYSYTTKASSNGNAVIENVEFGQYVVVSGGNSTGAYIYQTVTASVIPTVGENADGDNEYQIYPQYQVNMKTSEPQVDKEITAGTTIDGEGENAKQTASIGDSVNFTLSADVPTYPEGATNTTFYLHDTLSNGLSFADTTGNSFTVIGYEGTEDTVGERLDKIRDTKAYTITIDGQNLYIDFDYSKIRTFTKVVVSYNAVLNENAKVGGTGNPNDVTLVYSNSPYSGSTYKSGERPEDKTGYGKKTDSVSVYTYALIVEKYDYDSTSTKLGGATFVIYNNKNCDGSPIGTLTTNDNGYGSYVGLEAGTYWIKERVAPAGYKIIVDPIEVTINQDNAISKATEETEIEYTTVLKDSLYKVQAADSDGNSLWFESADSTTVTTTYKEGYLPAYVKSVTRTVTKVDNADSVLNGGSYVFGVSNMKQGLLPMTGGMGTVIFTTLGIILVSTAVLALIIKKRRATVK